MPRIAGVDLPAEKRIDNILSLMTLDEKIACLSTNPSVPRLDIRGTSTTRPCDIIVSTGAPPS